MSSGRDLETTCRPLLAAGPYSLTRPDARPHRSQFVRARAGSAVAIVAAFLLAAAMPAQAGRLGHNPANDPRLLNKPIEDLSYDRATRCRSGAQPGAAALADWISSHTRGELWGINRCEKWGPHSASVHAEGRAIDYRLDAGIAKEKRAAMHLIHVFLEPDRNGNFAALARRMGVQGLIFNCKAWFGGSGLGRYSACYKGNGKRDPHVDRTTAHKDHVHIELNWKGARKKTSFWRSPLSR